ncbi:hypothetical protein D0Z07_5702 [Hyphodiscus hymeniophilus]|uniref:DUF1993 domain-containing protein n=1 Tax=Hyphodiscus hymeniophilus TaxID=353542 RepID=A0A9P6VHI4_9HELO|nr:hypothetical protein D0Z07_5702 [Hyphodiscus hymeniophilus]
MTVTLYDTTVPLFITNVKMIKTIIEKGREKFSSNESELLESKLVEGMGGFIFQIQRISDTAKGLAVRAGNVAPVALPDNEKTFADVQARLQKTVDILESIKEDDFNASAEKTIKVPSAKLGAIDMSGRDYVVKFAIPNFFFHVCMTYALLRKAGVDVGKDDFLCRN